MDFASLLDSIPLWFYFIFTFIFSLVAFECGFRVSFSKFREKGAPFDSMVAAMLGLLAFLLAFTFGLAGNRLDSRRQVVLEEANAIGTTYLRAGYLEEPFKSSIRSLLKEYVEIRLDVIQTRKFKELFERTAEIHEQLWEQATILVKEGFDSTVVALFITSLNEVLDLHAKRVLLVFGMRIPAIMWFVLFLLTILSMSTMGYLSGFKKSRNIVISLSVVTAFTFVIVLIADLDSPQEGFLKVTQQPLIDIHKMMLKSRD